MNKAAIRYMQVLLCVSLAAMLLSPIPAMADPYPSNVQASPQDATSILVTWSGNAQAESYRIRRMNAAIEPEVPADVFSYLDTGLVPGMPYAYYVASIVNGVAYWSSATSGTAMAMPLDTPAITSLSSHTEADGNGTALLCFDLVYTKAGGATGYEIFAKAGDAGAFTQISETVESSVTVGFPLPSEATRYFFKVRAVNSFHWPEADEYETFFGNFSDVVTIDYEPYLLPHPIDIFLYEPVWPWDDPWAAEYLKSILSVYGTPKKWPTIPDTKTLSELARKILNRKRLTETEEQLAEAIHPHGLALLLGAYESPPDEQEAQALTKSLKVINTHMSGRRPETLAGMAQEAYLRELNIACSFVALSAAAISESGSGTVTMKIIVPKTGRLLFSSLPGSGALLEGLPVITPKPLVKPTTAPVIILRPDVFRIAEPTPAPEPTLKIRIRP